MAIKLRKWLKDSLHSKWMQGMGHPKEKGLHNETPYIHSINTYKTYRSQADHFCDWCYEQGIRTPEAAKDAVKDYIRHLEADGKSPWTVYTAISAMQKLMAVPLLFLALNRQNGNVRALLDQDMLPCVTGK